MPPKSASRAIIMVGIGSYAQNIYAKKKYKYVYLDSD